jgi:chromosome segregation protein
MYLKTIEMVGFKSFAERTVMNFEPGMMAIVGPNGCGKSNVSDAIRWVLGEQSPKALRGGAMTDVIFNGTDTARPLAMAEVSLTFTGCEQILGIDYHDVTITRRVFRSGEGQYFINRAACRLKDIQRLFMDTGIGTSSYCVMEQGHIDQILSSRPDDRREVFEEASGISRFKADRREALRKLEHTDANLLRLGDIIREVKRQIISLQRQVGKAKRYKVLQQRLQTLDSWLGHVRLAEADDAIAALDKTLGETRAREDALKRQVDGAAGEADAIRAELQQIESRIAAALEAASAAAGDLARSRERLRVNAERAAELDALSKRDTAETESARTALELHRLHIAELEKERREVETQSAAADAEYEKRRGELDRHEAATQKVRLALQSLRASGVSLDNALARDQQDLDALEARSRNDILRRERLSSEHQEALRAHESLSKRLLELRAEVQRLRDAADAAQSALSAAENDRRARAAELADAQRQAASLRADISARQAKIDLLATNRTARGFPPGAQHLLDSPDAAAVRGTLAEKIRTDKKHRRALETVLRPWLDALLVEDAPAALDLVRSLADAKSGSARLLPLQPPGAPGAPDFPGAPGTPLLSKIKNSAGLPPLLLRALARIRVLPDAAAIPALPLPPDGPDYVTLDGILARADGSVEIFLPAADETNPLAIEHQLAEWRDELAPVQEQAAALGTRIEALAKAETGARAAIDAARNALSQARHAASLAEGGLRVVERDAENAKRRAAQLETDLAAIARTTGDAETKRAALAAKINDARERQAANRAQTASETERLRLLEEERAARLDQTTESRVAALSLKQKRESIDARAAPLHARLAELGQLIQDRANGLASYRARLAALEEETANTQAGIPRLEARAAEQQSLLDAARAERDARRDALAASDAALHAARLQYDAVRDDRTALELRRERHTLNRQHLLDRLQTDYSLSPDDIRAIPPLSPQDAADALPPDAPPDAAPTPGTVEAAVADLRAKIQAMGPVNLVAIEESQELEERYAFLTQQNDDLLAAKEKLLALVKEINDTTTTLFTETFQKVNANFQELFTRLFGGGTAKLTLVDDANVLESGIDIIAKPPGKKPQTISLLSGGERTLTALALLFSLFKVKPSPFCLTDELDAPLDDSNISRYLDILRSFLDSTQFLVITHNWQTIAAAKALYGVTMERRGISKIVSVKFADAIEQAKADAAGTATQKPALRRAPRR